MYGDLLVNEALVLYITADKPLIIMKYVETFIVVVAFIIYKLLSIKYNELVKIIDCLIIIKFEEILLYHTTSL